MKKISLMMTLCLSFCASMMASPKSTPSFTISSFEGNLQTNSKLENVVRERTGAESATSIRKAPFKSLVEVPSDLEPVKYYLQSGEYFYSTLQGFVNGTAYYNTIDVAVQGDDIYIAGLFTYEPDSWIKGTIENGQAVFAGGQQVAEGETPGYLCASDNLEYYTPTIVFNYDSKNGLLTSVSEWIIESASPIVLMAYGYWQNAVFTSTPPEAPELVEAPAGLETESFLLSADDYETGQALYRNLAVGFDGNDVYIQGLCSVFPDSWIKGTRSGNTLTFPNNQYFGTVDGRYDFYLNKALKAPVVFKYSSSTQQYTCQNEVFFIDNGSNYFESFVKALMLPVSDEAGMPEDPILYDIKMLENGEGLYFDVSAIDVEGQGLMVSKLYYEFYYQENGQTNALVFTTENYPSLKEDMSLIPYGFTDGVNFFPSEIYLKGIDFSNWGSVGIRSIYYGGGETNATEIQWRPLKMVQLPADINLIPYQLTGYDPFYNLTVTHNVNVAFYGDNEFYMKGFSEFYPSALVKGTVDANGLISIPETFIAVGNHILLGPSKVFLLPVDIQYDKEQNKFTFLDKLLTYSYEHNTLFDELEDAYFVFIPNEAAVPSNPSIDGFYLYNEELAEFDHIVEYINMPYMHMSIPSYDTEKKPMIQEELYYTIWIEEADGTQKQLVFEPNLYTYLGESVTLIPYNFTDYYEFKEKGSEIYLNQNKDLIASWKRIGVQSVYFGGNEQNVSEIGWFDIEAYKNKIYETSGVESLMAEPAAVNYFDLQGHAVAGDAKGIIIKQTVMPDGSVKTTKVLNK